MEDFNNVSITGRLTRDPELKEIGTSNLVTISIASNKRTLKNGQWQDDPIFIECKMWAKDEKSQAHNLAKWYKKGQGIFVTGRLDIESWDRPDGSKASKSVIIVEKFFNHETKKASTSNLDTTKPDSGQIGDEPEDIF